jgi:hypothetical protein
MGWKDDYREYLKSACWRNRRKAKLAQVSACERCEREEFLVVHHKTYLRIGKELDADLEVLCKWCHNEHHGGKYTPRPAENKQQRARRKIKRGRAERRVAHERALAAPVNWDFRERLLSQDYWSPSSCVHP